MESDCSILDKPIFRFVSLAELHDRRVSGIEIKKLSVSSGSGKISQGKSCVQIERLF